MQRMKLVAAGLSAAATLTALPSAGQNAAETIIIPAFQSPPPPKRIYDNTKLMKEAWAGIGCGDRSILSDPKDIARLADDCRATKDSVVEANARFIRQLDARKEAMEAAARGDWRLGVTWPNFPPPPGQAPWNTPGVACENVGLPDLAVFAGLSDSASPIWDNYGGAIVMFLAAYNRALLSNPSFPAERRCRTGNVVGVPEWTSIYLSSALITGRLPM